MNTSEYRVPRYTRCDCFAELEMRLPTTSAQSGPLMALFGGCNMLTAYEKRAFTKWAGKDGQDTSWEAWHPPETPYPIGTAEAEQLKAIIETLQALPRYSELEAEAKARDTLVTTPLCQMANASAFLENTAHQTVSVATKGGNDAYPAQKYIYLIVACKNCTPNRW